MDHEAIVAAMKRPDFYPHPVDGVDYIQTHISSVFLTGSKVYKLKKPVDFGFLDFTSPDKRRHFCQEEVRLNRRLAPQIYLGVEPITQAADGALALGGDGPAVDYVVVMNQMDQDRLGPRLKEQGLLTPAHMEALVEQLVPFYRQAATGPEIDEIGRVESIKVNTDENFAQTEGHVPVCLDRRRFDEIRDFTNAFLEDRRPLFERRIAEGRIRECHGDLHLGNIIFDDPPIIFDAIEFNERFRYMDSAGDLAFLAMDLDFNGLDDLARHLVTTYAQQSGDGEITQVIPFYQCYYAYVRGKIHSFIFDDPQVRGEAKQANLDLARRYFKLAHRYAGGKSRPLVVVAYGLMGTGTSAVSRWLFGQYGWPVFRSDAIRKDLAGLTHTTAVPEEFNQGLYSPEMSARTYQHMLDQAAGFLAAGQSVVLDASFKTEAERVAAAELAEKAGADVIFIRTVCSLEEQTARLERRREKKGVSDGRLELMESQARTFAPPAEVEQDRLIILATDGPKEQTRANLDRELSRLVHEIGR